MRRALLTLHQWVGLAAGVFLIVIAVSGSALVWQLAFFLMAGNPVRYRPLMLVAVLEKLSFLATCLALLATGRLAAGGPLAGSLIDGIWMVLFAIAWWRTREPG